MQQLMGFEYRNVVLFVNLLEQRLQWFIRFCYDRIAADYVGIKNSKVSDKETVNTQQDSALNKILIKSCFFTLVFN